MENHIENSLIANTKEINQNSQNTNVLGAKREREADDQNKNLSDFKKKKSEERTFQETTENKLFSSPIQHNANLIHLQQYHQTNYNVYPNNSSMINSHIPMQGVYGYVAQPQLYYYNQTAIPSAIPRKIKIYLLFNVF